MDVQFESAPASTESARAQRCTCARAPRCAWWCQRSCLTRRICALCAVVRTASGRGLDRVCDGHPRGGHRGDRDRSVRRLWPDQEHSHGDGPPHRLLQGPELLPYPPGCARVCAPPLLSAGLPPHPRTHTIRATPSSSTRRTRRRKRPSRPRTARSCSARRSRPTLPLSRAPARGAGAGHTTADAAPTAAGEDARRRRTAPTFRPTIRGSASEPNEEKKRRKCARVRRLAPAHPRLVLWT